MDSKIEEDKEMKEMVDEFYSNLNAISSNNKFLNNILVQSLSSRSPIKFLARFTQNWMEDF